MGMMVEKVVAELMSQEARCRGLPSDAQVGSTQGQSASDAVAIMLDSTHEGWKTGDITGVLLMDIGTAFRSVPKGRLVNLMKVRKVDKNIIQWTSSCL